ncbi:MULTISPECIES: Ig-like domain-containing protein [Methanobacterium]|uniref:Ig-like domain-containing protein n=1 Tax=Methanobacterium veterum TaxID=408577 RepID=A0A9E5DL35_9EURY|nr:MULTISPECIES: Ig-like domain-containing protein [Methanobacterium]MCZ3366943.1 Ig-like domain-containing protein [Methanobacterium veterum]MCZ3373910.1 Ig-like domain-containing protein [Methanobacterium veterum]
MNVHFCQIVGNLIAGNARDIYNSSGSVNVEYNWWGSNDGPSAERIYGVTVSKWLVLTINKDHAIVKANGLSTITADLLHDNDGNYIDPNLGHVPDGITVNFNTNLGTIGSLSSLFNGIAQSTLSGGVISGVASVSAAVNSQTVNTLVTVDAVPPTVSSIDPVNKAKIKIVNKEIKIIFSELIQAGGTYGAISVTGPYGPISITKSISGTVLTLTPTSNYVDGIYSVNIPAGAVTDLVGNDLASALDSTFTVDTIAPTVSSNDPSNNAKIKATDKAITITFSEPIQAGSAYDSISIIGPSGAVSVTKNIKGNVLTITPISSYINGNYTVNIPVNAVTDLVGNGLESAFTSSFTVDTVSPVVTAAPNSGLSNSTINVVISSEKDATINYRINSGSWHTFTGSGKISISNVGTNKLEFYAVDRAGNPSAHKICSYTIDKTAPKVAATSPKNGAAGVSRTATISIRLSENILKSSNWSKIYIKNLKTCAKYKITAWVSGNHLYIKTNSKRAAYTWYQVYIPAAAIKDSAGNNLAATYAFKFKTGKY